MCPSNLVDVPIFLLSPQTKLWDGSHDKLIKQKLTEAGLPTEGSKKARACGTTTSRLEWRTPVDDARVLRHARQPALRSC